MGKTIGIQINARKEKDFSIFISIEQQKNAKKTVNMKKILQLLQMNILQHGRH